ncbi:hypothetical protein DOTSEDRAFT_75997 [Dothistroma septosporum NZE10]|uniref:Uncharacterized protein n=1 Tax=Dothistroma septosporum (strain NZE10 / CBS 128990) TaxID=675120 RepID=M2XGJ1_DOTSN|nr:hypothetical protein DOTSEDRAFT_75997 [Dothistroma septosporum NZE10]
MRVSHIAFAISSLLCASTCVAAGDRPFACLSNLQQEITELINDFAQTNFSGIVTDYIATRMDFTQCMFESVNYTAPECENKALPAPPNDINEVIDYLQQSQLGLSVVSHHRLENSKDIEADLCEAFRPYRAVACYPKHGFLDNMTTICPDARHNCPNVNNTAESSAQVDNNSPLEDPQPLIRQVQAEINTIINDFGVANISKATTDYVATRTFFADRLWRLLDHYPAACRRVQQVAPNTTNEVIASLQEVQLKLAVISRDVLADDGDHARQHLCDAWGNWQAVACYEGSDFRTDVTAAFEDVERWCPPRKEEDSNATTEGEGTGLRKQMGDGRKGWL